MRSEAESAIRVSGLAKQYGSRWAVDGLNLEIGRGELYALLGVNGAGKSTTIRMLSCLTPPTRGDAWLMGESIAANPAAVKRIIGISPQETAVAMNLTVMENLLFVAGIYQLFGQTARVRAEAMLGAFSLEEYAKSRAKTLSGGLQRRLSLAMALLPEPQILFLDEPTLGLDVLARRELWRQIERLKGRMTVVLTTHYMEEAAALSDRIGVMIRGKLAAEGTTEELMRLAGADTFEDAFVRLVSGEEAKK